MVPFRGKIIMSDKDKTAFAMKVEDYVTFLESGRKMEWSQKKELQSCGWLYRKKVAWSRTIAKLSGNGRSVTSVVYNVGLSSPLQTM